MDNECFDCDICCEQFDETGAHVPLVLPCGHTLCRQCVGRLQTPLCPTCKFPLHTSNAPLTGVVFPRNNWLIRCLLANKANIKQQTPKKRKKLSPGAPKVAVVGQRVLFKQLERARNRACSLDEFSMSSPISGNNAITQQQAVQDENHQERMFLLNLSRICKEKKALDSNFDQKRFVKEGLILKYGEVKAKRILYQVFDRIKCMRERQQGL